MLNNRINSSNLGKQMRGSDFSYLHVVFPNEHGSNLFLYDSKLFPSSFFCFAQNALVGCIGDLSNIWRKNLYLNASNYASKWGVVFVRGGESAVEYRHQSYVYILRDPQKVIPSLELEDLKYPKESCEVF